MWRGGRRGGYRRGRGGNTAANAAPVRRDASQQDGRTRDGSQASAPGQSQETEAAVPFELLLQRYWPGQAIHADDKRCCLIQALIEFLDSSRETCEELKGLAISTMTSVSIPVDWNTVRQWVPEIEEAMLHAPSQALTCLSIALHKKLIDDSDALEMVRIRLYHYSPFGFESLGSIKADRVGKLVTIRGTVTKISPIKAIYTQMNFICMRCKNTTSVRFSDGVFTPPTVCGTGFCQSRYLRASSRGSQCEDWQNIYIQALKGDQKSQEHDSQGIASSNLLEIELTHDLVDSCAPGDVITITGIVKVISSESFHGRGGPEYKRSRLFLPYIHAVSLRRAEDATSAAEAESIKVVAVPRGVSFLPPTMSGFTAKDLLFVQKYAAKCRGRSLQVLVASLAPGIFGMKVIKAGLIMSLFGGMHGLQQEKKSEQIAFRVRGDVHALLVGDPGLGKSKLLQAVANAAPRGVYVCGPSASAAGLTLSVSKSAGEFCLEAGALVTADRGVCCVDEFDKLSSEHAALLGVLEQQEVSIAKAGLVASLPARATIVAAANPVGGHYDKSLSLTQNLKMSPALISRFDLVFLMLDKPNQETDKRLAGHIMESTLSSQISESRIESPYYSSDQYTQGGRKSLRHALAEHVGDDEILPPQLVKKLVAYSKQYIHPKLSNDSKAIIKDFYLKLRQRAAGDVTSPAVTHRLLESLVRLSEARARVELRDIVTTSDALDAIEIMEETINGSLCNGPDTIIFDHPGKRKKAGKSGARFQQERDRYMKAVQRFCQRNGSKDIYIHDLFKIADDIELAIEDTSGFIAQLNDLGDLLKKPNNVYQYFGRI